MIKAIQTKYRGCLFRSRLEARWAVWLDAMKIKWEYEPEGFELPSGRYLPDFFLPFPKSEYSRPWDGWRNISAYWLEIKPGEPSEGEKRLLLELASATKHHAYCFAGSCDPEEVQFYIATSQGNWLHISKTPEDGLVWRYDLYMFLYGFLENLCVSDRIVTAFDAARSARFEHGQSPT